MKILHLSDLHISNENGYEFIRCTNNILNKITNLFPQNENDKPVIIITGDIANAGASINELFLKNAYENFIQRLKDNGFEVLIAPGNHDYGGYFGISIGKKSVNFFKDLIYGIDSNFPQIRNINKTRFIGLDSMGGYLKEDNFENAHEWYLKNTCIGYFGDKQLNDLQEKIFVNSKEVKFKVIYFHHNPFLKKFGWNIKDVDKFWKIIRGTTIDALLFGHDHRFYDNRFYTLNKEEIVINRCYDAGTSTGHIVNKNTRLFKNIINSYEKNLNNREFEKEIINLESTFQESRCKDRMPKSRLFDLSNPLAEVELIDFN